MPLQSKAQVRAFYAKGRGDLVKRWQGEAPVNIKSLPEHKGKAPIQTAAQRRVSRG